jgi:hypothetical protein
MFLGAPGDRDGLFAVVPLVGELEILVGIDAFADVVRECLPVGCIGKNVRAVGIAAAAPSPCPLCEGSDEGEE